MSRADDISKLFSKLGANPNGYREMEPVIDYIEDDVLVLEKAVPVPEPVAIAAPTPARIEPTLSVLEPVGSVTVDEAPSAPLQRLLDELSQGEADHVHPPEMVESPTGPVYSERSAPRIIAVVSLKGGVGRSTLTAAIASGLQRQGHPALALDLDPQNAVRHHLCLVLNFPGIGATSLRNESWEGLAERGFAGCRMVAFGDTDSEQQKSLTRWLGQDTEWLGKRLAGLHLNGQDTLVIDVPAGDSVYLRQALALADVALVAVQPDVTSFSTLGQVDTLLAPFQAREKKLRHYYVLNQLDGGHRFSLDLADVFKARLGDALLGTVHREPAFHEAQAGGRDPLDPTVNSPGCQDILSLCRTLLERIDSDLS
ncbi:MAG: Cellulose biosynthesis protein BcsQ [Pseudomonas sp.]|nr:MAG: Cellulose biosynthesis protein BcsQ [Pseudomonas sp.]